MKLARSVAKKTMASAISSAVAGRPDGAWADFNAYACRGKPEAIDELVFSSMPKVMEVFGKLFGRARVVDLPIDEAGLKAWLERQQHQDPLEAARAWAVQYRTRHRK